MAMNHKKVALTVLVIAAMFVAFGAINASAATTSKTASAAATAPPATGACGGGQTFDQAVAGWKAHGTLDDVMRWAGVDPNGADGKPLDQLRKSLVKKKVIRGASAVANNTCKRGMFQPLTKAASQAAGTFIWTTRERIAQNGAVREWFAADCGNLRGGLVFVPVPQPAPAKPARAGATGPTGPAGKTGTINAKCSIVVIGNNNKVAANQCNLYQIQLICSSGPVTITGPNAKQVGAMANNYGAKNNCSATTPKPTPVRYEAIVKKTPGYTTRTSFRYNVVCGKATRQVRAWNDAVPVKYVIPPGVATCTVTELKAKGWRLVSMTRSGNTVTFTNQKEVVAPAAIFYGTISKNVTDWTGNNDVSWAYAGIKMPVSVSVNGTPAFTEKLPMDGRLYGLGPNGSSAWGFHSGDVVKACIDKALDAALQLESGPGMTADGCKSVTVTGNFNLGLVDRALKGVSPPITSPTPTPAPAASSAPPPTTTPPAPVASPATLPVNHPPTIQWVNVNGHEIPTGENDQFCALMNDPDGNSLSVWFSAALGHTSAAYRPDPWGSPGQWCTSYTAPPAAGTETFTANVSDGIAATVTIISTFQIVALPDGF